MRSPQPFTPAEEETLRLGTFKDGVTPPPVVCPGPDCARPNPRARTFCACCGTLLRPPLPPPPRPWWLRITEGIRGFLRRRPRVWHRERRWYAPAAGAAAVLTLTLAGAGPSLTGPVRQGAALAYDRFASKAAVAASAVSASSRRAGYPARCAADGVDNRAWAPAPSGEQARGQWWQAEFTHPFRLTTLVVFNGVSLQPQEYLAAGRPQRLRAVAITAGKRAFVKELDLTDQPGPQTFSWGVDDVQSVRLQIIGVRAADGKGAKAPVGLAEVQFFTRRSQA
ncbi:NADase-type glycan-binding domain-containing protein [Streptomyces sp. BA2]|uniref:NADase-type glycan-binding domain-containing protein n=1 Tax=Streptomyces sp. BA2 TaxID=436595 RepID=UPI00132866F3|nr:hypothetical protein [Streptomyces sp. BA2]MWA07840.1 hypothetical protein [Streptomyces sp. BA2]